MPKYQNCLRLYIKREAICRSRDGKKVVSRDRLLFDFLNVCVQISASVPITFVYVRRLFSIEHEVLFLNKFSFEES